MNTLRKSLEYKELSYRFELCFEWSPYLRQLSHKSPVFWSNIQNILCNEPTGYLLAGNISNRQCRPIVFQSVRKMSVPRNRPHFRFHLKEQSFFSTFHFLCAWCFMISALLRFSAQDRDVRSMVWLRRPYFGNTMNRIIWWLYLRYHRYHKIGK